MDINLLSILSCPSCLSNYEPDIHNSDNDHFLDGLLICPECQTSIPVIAGFPLFNEARPWFKNSVSEWLSDLKKNFYHFHHEYDKFIRRKKSRKNTDLYAAFQPFNESTRAIYPFIELLEDHLEQDDVILDTWCRTGWSGELLAGLFPDNRIISIWEGNNNVLGYKGFAYWLDYQKRSPNHDVIFSHQDYPLPFKSDSFALLHGLDSLHRYRQGGFISECLRIARKDGVLIFPHIHLNNSQPSPYFDRGCHQYHGREWKEWLESIVKNTRREAWVLSELKLFEVPENYKLIDESNTKHYNALVLIADKKYENRPIKSVAYPDITSNTYFIINPLLDINLHQCRVSHFIGQQDALFSDIFDRHPCYSERVKKDTGYRLTMEQSRFIWFASNAYTLDKIAYSMKIKKSQAVEIAHDLCRREILHPAKVSRSQALLQSFYGVSSVSNHCQAEYFSQLWDTAIENYGNNEVMLHWLEDNSELTSEEVLFLVNSIRCRFEGMGIQPGMRILISSEHHPETLLLLWASWIIGVVTVVVPHNYSIEKISRIYHDYNVKLLFTDNSDLKSSITESCILFDTTGEDNYGEFTKWLEPAIGLKPKWQCTDSQSDAVILFTSGSTGTPKGVVLSQQAICSSATNMATSFNWHKEVLLSLGPLSMMSGLRNPALASLVSLSKILIPGRNTVQFPASAWEHANTQRVSVITAVPFWFRSLLQMESRLSPPRSLKQILLTGTTLEPFVYQQTHHFKDVFIGNYYGLTETGGICTATLSNEDAGTLGYPVGALLHIVNQDDEVVGVEETGELYVLSEQVMSRYLNEPEETDKIKWHGYIKTGDLAHWDSLGRLVLNGRTDERLKLRNGALLNPSELETIMLSIESIESVAVDVFNDKLIALVISAVEIKDIYNQLIPLVDNTILPDQIFKVPQLPVNIHGKLERKNVSEIIQKLV